MNSEQNANIIYNIGNIGQANMLGYESSLKLKVKNLFYKSSIMDDREVEKFIKDESQYKYLSEYSFSDIVNGECYCFEGEFDFEQIYNNGSWLVQLKASINGIKLSGKTSPENWLSESLLNNILDVGYARCVSFFKVLGKNKNLLTVQFLIIEGCKL